MSLDTCRCFPLWWGELLNIRGGLAQDPRYFFEILDTGLRKRSINQGENWPVSAKL